MTIRSRFLLPAYLVFLCAACGPADKASVQQQTTPTSFTAPTLSGNETWFNVKSPLRMETLKGRVVLVYFWSSASINAVRSLRYVNRWYTRYQETSFEIIGIHAPQFVFEKDPVIVERALAKYRIAHPVVVDNAFRLWSQYKNKAWPTFYLIDSEGQVRHVMQGEDRFLEVESRLRLLLEETGVYVPPRIEPPASIVDFSRLGTPEIHFGYERLSHFGSPEPLLPDKPQVYSADLNLAFNHFYLSGAWEFQKEIALLRGRGGRFLIQYEASRVYAVVGAMHESRLRAEVRLDGKPLTADNYGKDIWFRDGKSYVEIDHDRLYELVDNDSSYGTHVLEIIYPSSDVKMHAIMFG